MAELSKMIADEWWETRERIHQLDDLYNYLCADAVRAGCPIDGKMPGAVEELEKAIMDGVIEFKRHRLSLIFNELDTATYSSDVFPKLGDLEGLVRTVIMVSAAERGLIHGELPFVTPAARGGHAAEEQPGEDQAVEVKQIIGDIQEIVAADPSAKMNAAIKNILMQLQRYRKEVEAYKKLRQQASDYRLEMYSRTFSATFAEIFSSIKHNYQKYLDDQAQNASGAPSVLSGIETGAWIRELDEQLQIQSRIRATLTYALSVDTGKRSPLVNLAKEREEIFAGIEREQDAIEEASGGEQPARRLSRLLAREISAWLARKEHEN